MTDDNPRSSWPPNFMDGFVSGYLNGLQRGRAQAEHEMDASWAVVAHRVHAMAGLKPWTAHEVAVRTRQEAACEANRAAARPWPTEDPHPSARVLNGWPDP